jgi:hypothetical protein
VIFPVNIFLIYILFFICSSAEQLLFLGKCDTCFAIDDMRRTCQDETTLCKLRDAHHLHRGGLFMLERLAYKQRCHAAIVSNLTETKPKIMSIIIDGMDQAKCHIPYCGGQQSMNNPLVQHITGD